MLTYKPAQDAQYDRFLQLMLEQTDIDYDRVLNLMRLTREEYTTLFKTRGQVFGVYSDEQLAGFYWVELRGDELHLHGLILQDAFQGQGIGTAILNKLECDFGDRACVIELGVDQNNVRAQHLYERMGYEPVKILDDVGFLVMQKRLSNREAKNRP